MELHGFPIVCVLCVLVGMHVLLLVSLITFEGLAVYVHTVYVHTVYVHTVYLVSILC